MKKLEVESHEVKSPFRTSIKRDVTKRRNMAYNDTRGKD